MTGVVELVALIVLLALVGWVVGSLALRLGGVLVVLVGLVAVAFAGEAAAGLAAIVVGTVAWLAGHWLYAFRRHEYRSPLAQRVFLQALPRRLDPTGGWGVSTTAAPTPAAPAVRIEVAQAPRPAAPEPRHTARGRRRRPESSGRRRRTGCGGWLPFHPRRDPGRGIGSFLQPAGSLGGDRAAGGEALGEPRGRGEPPRAAKGLDACGAGTLTGGE